MCRHIHDAIGGRLPKPLLKVYSPNSTIHSYNTRQRNYPHTASRRNIIIAKQITNQGIGIWSRQSQNIRNIAPRNSFKRKLKQYFICLYWWKYYLITGSGNSWLSMTRRMNTYLNVHYTYILIKVPRKGVYFRTSTKGKFVWEKLTNIGTTEVNSPPPPPRTITIISNALWVWSRSWNGFCLGKWTINYGFATPKLRGVDLDATNLLHVLRIFSDLTYIVSMATHVYIDILFSKWYIYINYI